MLNQFDEERMELVSKAKALAAFASARGSGIREKDFLEQCDKILSNNFLIAAFGGFSSGKSTFFNALVGEKIFPSLNTPTTASINYLTMGDTFSADVTYKTRDDFDRDVKSLPKDARPPVPGGVRWGESEGVDPAALIDLSRDNETAFAVQDIMVRHPSPHLAPEGVIWVDTPGTDSVISHHKQVTYSLINKADAILFFIYAPVPFKDSDWRFLQDIQEIRKALKSDKFFFVVNAIDAVDDDPEDILAFIRNKLERKAGITNPQMVPISSKLALLSRTAAREPLSPGQERAYRRMLLQYVDDPSSVSPEKALEYSNFTLLQDRISRFLHEEKGQVLIATASDRLINGIAEMRGEIAMERWSMTKTVQELDSVMNEKILPELRSKETAIRETVSRMESRLSAVNPGFGELDNAVNRVVESQAEQERVNPDEVEAVVRRHTIRLRNQVEEEMQGIVQNAYREIGSCFNDFQGKMLGEIQVKKKIPVSFDMSALSLINPSEFVEEVNEGGGEGLGLIGAIIGGIGAILFPGGLGFFAGAALGGLAGNAVGSSNSGGDVRRIFDAMGFKRKMMSKVKVGIEPMKKKMLEGVRKTAERISKGVLGEAEERLDRIRGELQRIAEKRRGAEDDRVETGRKLDGQEKELLEYEKTLTTIRKRIG